MYYALFYDTVPDYLERRTPFRGAHLAHAEAAVRAGRMLLGGALTPSGALIVFKCDSPAVVEQFAREDPYVRNGVVTGWRVQEWTVVVGTAIAAGGV